MRNETAEDFLSLLKEWEKLCALYSLIGSNDSEQQHIYPKSTTDEGDSGTEANDDDELDPEEFEVEQILSVRYCEPKESEKSGLQLKVLMLLTHYLCYGFIASWKQVYQSSNINTSIPRIHCT